MTVFKQNGIFQINNLKSEPYIMLGIAIANGIKCEVEEYCIGYEVWYLHLSTTFDYSCPFAHKIINFR